MKSVFILLLFVALGMPAFGRVFTVRLCRSNDTVEIKLNDRVVERGEAIQLFNKLGELNASQKPQTGKRVE